MEHLRSAFHQKRDPLQSDQRLDLLIDRLPGSCRPIVRRLRQPSAFWMRVPAGVLLVCAGALSFLPVLGLWMMPLGLALLADDVPPLRRLRSRILDWIERRHPHWFGVKPCHKGGGRPLLQEIPKG